MGSGSSWLSYAPLEIALKATAFALFVIGILIFYIWARRTYRGRYFALRDARAFAIRRDWNRIVSLDVPAATWREARVDRELVEAMLLDAIDVGSPEELPKLVNCLRQSGLLDRYVVEARSWSGWHRQRALAKLGRTRAPEAIPALAEALDSHDPAVVTAAVRGLGHMGISKAAAPILDRLAQGTLRTATVPLKHALVNTCRERPSVIVPFLSAVTPPLRELLTQVLGQIATPELAEDLAVLAGDSSPEVRAAAARALGACSLDLAVGLLFTLVLDDVWFVRLRAVSSLGNLHDPATIDSLVRCLSDPNRIVRQRAAMALVPLETKAGSILKKVIAKKDKYALHSFVSELQRSGQYSELVVSLTQEQCLLNEQLIAAAESARLELQQKVTAVV